MLFSDVISRVRTIAGDTSSLQFTDSQVVAWINEGVRECALANQLLQVTASQDSVIGTAAYSLPTDILKLHSIKYDSSKLPIKTIQEIDETFTIDTEQGTPVVAWVWANTLNFYPVPDSIVAIQVLYNRLPVEGADGTATVDLPLTYQTRLIDYCLAQVAQQDDDNNRYQLKMEEFRTGVQNLKDNPEWEYDLYPFPTISNRDMGDQFYDEG